MGNFDQPITFEKHKRKVYKELVESWDDAKKFIDENKHLTMKELCEHFNGYNLDEELFDFETKQNPYGIFTYHKNSGLDTYVEIWYGDFEFAINDWEQGDIEEIKKQLEIWEKEDGEK